MLEDVISKSWTSILQSEFDSPYMQNLANWLQVTRESKTIYPDSEDVFRALKLCPYGQVKVVIIGQEPYYQGNADGLAFSYKNGNPGPNGKQSLDIVLDEIENDCYNGFNVNKNYQLDYLAKQGVLLLKSVLTVFRGKVGSHAKTKTNPGIGWEQFTSCVILSQIREKSPKVFLLWGRVAQAIFDETIILDEKANGFSNYRHLILSTYHPASDLYNRDSFGNVIKKYPDGFTGCKHFSQTNKFLIDNQIEPINWLDIEEPYFNKDLKADFQPF